MLKLFSDNCKLQGAMENTIWGWWCGSFFFIFFLSLFFFFLSFFLGGVEVNGVSVSVKWLPVIERVVSSGVCRLAFCGLAALLILWSFLLNGLSCCLTRLCFSFPIGCRYWMDWVDGCCPLHFALICISRSYHGLLPLVLISTTHICLFCESSWVKTFVVEFIGFL